MNYTNLIKNFAPGWYAIPMGTGAFAISSLPISYLLAQTLHWLNVCIFFILLVPWLARLLVFREQSKNTLQHPIQAHFYPMFSIACLVIANQWLTIQVNVTIASIFWGVGVAAAFFFSFLILTIVFRGEHTTLDHVIPSIYIPAVGLVVIPIAGSRLASITANSDFSTLHTTILLINIVGLGAGLFMYLSLLALTLHRHVLHQNIRGPLTPTLWIQLAPLGILPMSLSGLASQFPSMHNTQSAVDFVSVLIWGFGFWWAILAASLTMQAIRHKEISFALSWWAFVFPQGAFVLATQNIGFFDMSFLSLPLWVFLAITWILVSTKTMQGIWSGELLK